MRTSAADAAVEGDVRRSEQPVLEVDATDRRADPRPVAKRQPRVPRRRSEQPLLAAATIQHEALLECLLADPPGQTAMTIDEEQGHDDRRHADDDRQTQPWPKATTRCHVDDDGR